MKPARLAQISSRFVKRLQAWWVVATLLPVQVTNSSAMAHAQAGQASAQPPEDSYTQEVDAALMAYNSDDFERAREHFLKAHQLKPSARTWRGLGTTAFELQYYEDAIRELTFALEDPRNALPSELRTETELTLRVARRRLADSQGTGVTSGSSETGRAATLPAGDAPSEAPRHRALARAEVDGVEGVPPLAVAGSAPSEGLGGARVAALVVGATGLAALGVGVGFGLHSLSKGDERDSLCPPAQQPACSQVDQSSADAARQAADAAIVAGNVASISFITGGVLLTGGLVLWLTGGDSERSNSTAKLALNPRGFSLSGRF